MQNLKSNQTEVVCMFAMHFDAQYFSPYLLSLEMPWASLILINLSLEIGPLLMLTTVFECIAAQSPPPWKDWLLHCFCDLRILSIIGLISFTSFFAERYLAELTHEGVPSCQQLWLWIFFRSISLQPLALLITPRSSCQKL